MPKKIESMNGWLSTAAALIALASMAGIAHAAPTFPRELSGTWDMGPQKCVLPVNPDSDSPMRITGSRIQNYEDVDELLRIKRISSRPLAWHVTTTNDIAPGVIQRDIYVLDGDMLTVTSGSATVEYMRCKAKTTH